MESSSMLGKEKVKRLIFNLGWPAALNFLVVTIYNLTDVIFVGRYLGSLQIAAVVVVGTIIFLFSSFGLAIGLGGASIIARALGEKDREKAAYVFGNQTLLVGCIGLICVLTGWFFESAILKMIGAKGEILPFAQTYYRILLMGIPFFSWSMMGNNIIHTEGKAKIAMFNSLLPTVLNIILNPVFIKGFGMGIAGAAWATLIGYIVGFLLVFRFFAGSLTELDIRAKFFRFKAKTCLLLYSTRCCLNTSRNQVSLFMELSTGSTCCSLFRLLVLKAVQDQ
jgi:putative MATE family efflux protein